jgi:hypothetical protein
VADIDVMRLRDAVLCGCGAPLAPTDQSPRDASWRPALCPTCRRSEAADTVVTRRVLSELVADERGYALHRRLLPESATTVDHLFVGATAVYVITVVPGADADAEVLVERTGGRFAAGTEALTVAGRSRTDLVDAVHAQSAEVAAGLVDLGQDELPVVPVLCFVHAHLARRARHRRIGDVRLVSPENLAEEIAGHGALDGDRRFAIAMSLVSFLPSTS